MSTVNMNIADMEEEWQNIVQKAPEIFYLD